MARSVTWRHSSPEKVKERVELASTARLYILHQTGPTGFHIKEEGKERKLKVFLGDPHTCSCNIFMNERELCVHILWLLIKKFKLKREDPLLHQRGLIEREINDLVLRELGEKKRSLSQETERSSSCTPSKQKEVQEGDACPICQEDLTATPTDHLTYCRQSCGKSLHVRCMKMWADHQKSLGETKIKCPLCREDFGPYENLQKESLEAKKQTYKQSRAPNVHTGCVCCRCHADPVVGVCYRCRECENYFLCSKCYIVDSHNPTHAFQARRYLSQKWKRAEAVKSTPSLPPGIAHSIESKELSSEDYEMLLQLDSVPDPSRGVAEHILFKFPIHPIKAASSLLLENERCDICKEVYKTGDWVRKLPNCLHQFHRDCIDYKLRYFQTTCPIDGTDVYPKRKTEKRFQSRSATLPQEQSPKSSKPGCLVTGPLLGLGSLPSLVSRERGRIEMFVSGEQMVRATQTRLGNTRPPLPSAPSTQTDQTRNRAPLSLLNCKPIFSQQQQQQQQQQQHSPIRLPSLTRSKSQPHKFHPSNPTPTMSDVKRNRKRTESERSAQHSQIQQLYIGMQTLEPAANQSAVAKPTSRLRPLTFGSKRRNNPHLEQFEVTTVPCTLRKDV